MLTLDAPAADKLPQGTSAAEAIGTFKKKIEEGIEEAKVLDSDLNLSFNLGLDVEAQLLELALVALAGLRRVVRHEEDFFAELSEEFEDGGDLVN